MPHPKSTSLRAVKEFLVPDWKVLVSVLICALGFPPWNFPWPIWFAPALWFWALDGVTSYKTALSKGWWWSLGATVSAYYWTAYAIHHFGELNWAISILGLLLFSLICQPQAIIFSWYFVWTKKIYKNTNVENRSSLLLFITLQRAFFYVGVEKFLGKIFTDSLGNGFYVDPYFRQVAALGGVPLMTFLLIFFNLTLYELVSRLRKREEPSIWPTLRVAGPPFLVAFALALGSYLWGVGENRRVLYEILNSPQSFHFSVIQGNIGDFEKVAAETGSAVAADRILDVFTDLSDQAAKKEPKPDFIVWPETTYPAVFRSPLSNKELARDQRVEDFVNSRGIPILFGGYDRQNNKDFNSLFMLSPQFLGPNDLQVYHKNILLPFGEYIPGMENVEWVKQMLPQMGFFGRGPGPTVFTLRSPDQRQLQISPIICYEALFPWYSLTAARNGAQVILNITNDSWFGIYGEPYLHLALTVFRSIETRLPQIRATNTGITTMTMPDGTMVNQSRIGVPEVLNYVVKAQHPAPTLMVRWGDWFGLTSIFLALPLLLFSIVIGRRKI